MFTKAIVRKPGRSVVHGISTAGLGAVDYPKMCRQHEAYIDALKKCGLEVIILDQEERFPDSVFMEDVALLTSKCAVVTRPGAKSRQGEEKLIKPVLSSYYNTVEQIEPPGTLEAGDVMMAGTHFYIGLSERTNQAGAEQLISILEKYGFSASKVHLKDILHLKTGISFIENNTVLIAEVYKAEEAFSSYNKLWVDSDESYAANCVWINGHVLLPAGNPKIKASIENEGFRVIELEMSEFRKLDGGLSCLSLRF
jgi:dimethylargininase